MSRATNPGGEARHPTWRGSCRPRDLRVTATDIPAHLEPDIRWYDRLQLRVMLLVLGVVVLSVGLAAGLLHRITTERLQDAMARTTEALAVRVADCVRDPLRTHNYEALESVVEPARQDSCFGFAIIEDVYGRTLINLVEEPELWYEYATRVGLTPGATAHGLVSADPLPATAAALPAIGMPEAMLIRLPVTRPVNRSAGTSPESEQRVGFVTVAVVDPILRKTLVDLERAASAVILIITLISIPLAVVVVRHVTHPLRLMTQATSVLAGGSHPPPLPVGRNDEIGVLARSFNEMAASLAEATEQLRASNTRLERQVEERTREVRRINRRLEHEVRTKNEFLRSVTHDLNAPLRNIAGMTEMICQRFGANLPDEVLTRLDRIRANVEAETGMLDDLLELSRLRTAPAHPEPIPVRAIVDRVHGIVEHDLRAREIEFQVADGLPAVYVEPSLLQQVMLNLIDNAIKYMGPQAVRRIGVGASSDADWIRIWVEDTGPGIHPDDQLRVFQVFQRGRYTSTPSDKDDRDPDGRGIGLAGVRLVAERWEGAIELDSEVGRGSRFTLLLPADRLCAEHEARSVPEGSVRPNQHLLPSPDLLLPK